jgi:arginase
MNDIARVCEQLFDAALESLNAGALPLVLGGDHSLGAGSMAAAASWARATRRQPIGLRSGCSGSTRTAT